MSEGFLTEARREFHATITALILTRNNHGIPSNADSGSNPSIQIANAILEQLGPASTAEKLPGQTTGANFESICASFIEVSFDRLRHLRPGTLACRVCHICSR